MARLFLSLLLAVGLTSVAIAQTTWYVDDDNCPGPGTGAQGDPFCRIQDGIGAASDGDTVLVMPGTYVETIDFLGKAITVRSDEGPEVMVIDANHAGIAVRMVSGEASTAMLQGFTVRNAADFSYYGGGISIGASSPTIRGNIIENNACRMGGIVFYSGACPLIEGNVVRNNHATTWGGAMLGDFGACPIIRNNIIYANAADSHGQGLRFWSCGDGSLKPRIINNTIVYHTADGVAWNGGVIESDSGSWLYVRNNIIAFNKVGLQCTWGGVMDSDYNDVYGNETDYVGCSPGANDISADPQFVDPINLDYHLSLGSLCIDAGTNAAPELPSTDFDGDARVLDGDGDGTATVDMGADEFLGSVANAIVTEPGDPFPPVDFFTLEPLIVHFDAGAPDGGIPAWITLSSGTLLGDHPTTDYAAASPTTSVWGPGGVVFDFTGTELPTQVGVVFTDLGSTVGLDVTFEAWSGSGASGQRLAWVTATRGDDGTIERNFGDDCFFGVRVATPIGSVRLYAGANLELDILHVAVPEQVPVDLAIYADDIWFSDSNPDPSEEFTVTVSFANNSSTFVENVSVAVDDDEGERIYTGTVDRVDAWGTGQVSFVHVFAEMGFFPLRAYIDVNGEILETNEINNNATRPIVVGDYAPPGAIEITGLPQEVEVGPLEWITLAGSAHYEGTPQEDPPVQGGTVTFSLSWGGELETHTTDSGSFSQSLRVPAGLGYYQVLVTVTDYTLTAQDEVIVHVFAEGDPPPPPPQGPDLCVAVACDPPNPCAGGDVSVSWAVWNAGNLPSTETSAKLAGEDGTVLMAPLVPALDPGEHHTLAGTTL
ncbi:MAG: CARDB domain-containing protein, partial [Planctomycetota bacterium]